MYLKSNEKGNLSMISIVSLILVVCLCTAGGLIVGMKLTVNDAAVMAVAKSKESLDTELTKSASDLDQLKKEIKSQQPVLEELSAYKENKAKYDTEIEEKSKQISTLDGQIEAKKEELSKLTGQVDTIKNAPIVLSAGVYVVGSDVPAGKYDIQWISGSGNFFGDGDNFVNEIFGTHTSYGHIKEYKNASFRTGDKIELTSGLKVQLIKK